MKLHIFIPALLLVAFASLCSAEVGVKCTEKSQCADDECCQIVNILVVSKKRQLIPQELRPNHDGTCQKYRKEGDSCNSFDAMNGYCSCGEGLTCRSFHMSTLAAPSLHAVLASKRSMAPGWYSACSAN